MASFLQSVREILQIRLFSIAGTPIDIATIILFLVIIGATFLVSRLLTRSLHHYFNRKGIHDEGTIVVTTRLVHFIVLAIGFGIAIHTIGINLAALFAAGALFAVGLGFAMQNIAQNFVSGVILMVERAIKPNDVLWVEGQMVRVVRMGHRAIVARTLDDEDLIIPNSVLVQSTVKNYTLRDQLYRIRVEVGVVYGSDMRVVRKALERCANDYPDRNKEKKPVVLMTSFGDSSVVFEVSVWIDNAWNTRQARSRLHEAIWWSLKDAGVTIAFPQLDVHFDPPVSESIQAMGKRQS
jgi:potassium efflux system protein